MLVLSRKKEQSIVISGGIEIQVLQVKGGTVKLGISAPNDVRIVRGELDLYSDLVGAGELERSPRAPIESGKDQLANDHLANDQLLEMGVEYLTEVVAAR